MNLPPPANSESRPSTSRTISKASLGEATSILQREKASVQQALDRCKAEYTDLRRRSDELRKERDHFAAQDAEQRQMIQNLHKELGGDAELDDDDDDDSYMRSIKRGCERRLRDSRDSLPR